MSTTGDGFQLVTRKKWMARKCLCKRNQHRGEADILGDVPDVDVDTFQVRLERVCKEMSQSDYFIQSMETLQHPLDVLKRPLERIVCLGLGPLTRTRQSLHQAAFIISAQRHLNINEALYYDPIFRDIEKDLIQRLNGTVLIEDRSGRHNAKVPTLFYLPHCAAALTHNLLWCNWTRDQLPNVFLISNSFEMLSLTRTKSKPADDLIARITPYCTESSLEDDYKHSSIFNDFSLHTFPSVKLPAADDAEFWTRCNPLKVHEDETQTESLTLGHLAALSIGS